MISIPLELRVFLVLSFMLPILWKAFRKRQWLSAGLFGLVLLGAISNFTVMLLNHGLMPVEGWQGHLEDIHDGTHVLASRASHLVFLADIWGLWGARISLGDILEFAGFIGVVTVFIHERTNRGE